MSQTGLVLCLGLVSAISLALANFAVKRGGDVLVARLVLSAGMALCVLPFAPFVPPVPLALWPMMLAAVAVHWLYQASMVRALHRGELSMVFPVMRGLAPLVTAVLAFLTLGETLEPVAITGLVLASLAIIVFAIPAPGRGPAAHPHASTLIWAGLTACGIAAYSVTDAHVARQMPSAGTFIVWLFLLDWVGIAVAVFLIRGRAALAQIRTQARDGLLGGVVGTLSYGAAVYAFTLTDTTALVTALRETSVVFAALLGAFALKESFGPRRIAAAGVLAAGLVMMQVSA